jgi:hypothetical protein
MLFEIDAEAQGYTQEPARALQKALHDVPGNRVLADPVASVAPPEGVTPRRPFSSGSAAFWDNPRICVLTNGDLLDVHTGQYVTEAEAEALDPTVCKPHQEIRWARRSPQAHISTTSGCRPEVAAAASLRVFGHRPDYGAHKSG